ncbi:MAG TPA: DUF6677 family protein [Phycisphaerales bacterium]|nr:DUF6677 family protein [Phycisphaerales bacterium]
MTTSNDDVGFHWLALLAACAFPGAGHFVRGERSRAAAVCTGVMGLFLGGMLVGGIDVIDSKEDRPWFYAQSLVGPAAFGVDWLHQNKLKVVDVNGRLRSANPDEGRDPKTGRAVAGGTPPKSMSVGRVNELGMLMAGLAGMVNLIVIIDAGFPSKRTDGSPPKKKTSDALATTVLESAGITVLSGKGGA